MEKISHYEAAYKFSFGSLSNTIESIAILIFLYLHDKRTFKFTVVDRLDRVLKVCLLRLLQPHTTLAIRITLIFRNVNETSVSFYFHCYLNSQNTKIMQMGRKVVGSQNTLSHLHDICQADSAKKLCVLMMHAHLPMYTQISVA